MVSFFSIISLFFQVLVIRKAKKITSCSYVCSFLVFFYACALTFYVFFSSYRLA